ncbi:AraC family transcriptional regulator [Cohnella endophytica]|uniref:AraC family transcriptional regulator n=1 Tax=Cohnella endophytica TaxID=2419778 RepID=A0A494XY05_9BACL|nr:helix-turn-helix domain-containing protein [Cohnella endophytica]RKP52999.1 AraC family transcriptional regulator [Cohnella endophytica]
MNLLRTVLAKKYFLRIFLWITFIILLIVSSFSALIYFNVERNVFKSEYKNSQKVLTQMKFNIDYLNAMIRNLTLSTYSNNDVKALMYLNDEETYEHLNVINKLNATIVGNNPFIKSIYIYNNHKKIYYSTYGDLYHKDDELVRTLKAYKTIPSLKAIVRRMEPEDRSKSESDSVLTYVMYETTDNENNMDGAIILNIKLDWLVDNIRTINQVDTSTHSELYILDDENRFIETDPTHSISDKPFARSLEESYEQSIAKTGTDKSGYFIKSKDGEKYTVSYIHLDNTGWTLLEAKPYNVAYANLKQLLDTIVLITIAIFAGAILITVSVSRGIYSPVRKLMEQTSSGLPANDSPRSGKRDEFSYLTEVYQRSRERLYEYDREATNNTAIMKLYFLRKLLLNSHSLNEDEFQEIVLGLNTELDKNKPFLIGVLRIDEYERFLQSKSMAERELLRFAVSNVTTELLSKSFVAQAVDMKDDSFTLLLNVGDRPEEEESLVGLLQEAQAYIQKHYQLSFTVAIGQKVHSYKEITEQYNETFANSSYRFVFGRQSIITPARIAEQRGAELEQVLEAESKFIDSVRRGDKAKADERLNGLIQRVGKLEYGEIRLVNMQIVHHLKKAVQELNQMRKEPITIHNKRMDRQLYEEETIEEFKRQLSDIVSSISSEGQEYGAKGNLVVVDTIQEIIESNYFDSSLGATVLSEMLRLSPYKLSKIAKEYFGMSIPEYINQYRLNKAVEWMENSKLSIQEIMRRVGVENESYFYKLFKAKFGMTPREYMARQTR